MIGRLLFGVVRPDAVMRGLQRGLDLGRDARGSGINLGLGEFEGFGGDAGLVELVGQLDHGRIAAVTHVGDNGGNGLAHFLAGFAFAAEQLKKTKLEIGLRAVEANGHERPAVL